MYPFEVTSVFSKGQLIPWSQFGTGLIHVALHTTRIKLLSFQLNYVALKYGATITHSNGKIVISVLCSSKAYQTRFNVDIFLSDRIHVIPQSFLVKNYIGIKSIFEVESALNSLLSSSISTTNNKHLVIIHFCDHLNEWFHDFVKN